MKDKVKLFTLVIFVVLFLGLSAVTMYLINNEGDYERIEPIVANSVNEAELIPEDTDKVKTKIIIKKSGSIVAGKPPTTETAAIPEQPIDEPFSNDALNSELTDLSNNLPSTEDAPDTTGDGDNDEAPKSAPDASGDDAQNISASTQDSERTEKKAPGTELGFNAANLLSNPQINSVRKNKPRKSVKTKKAKVDYSYRTIKRGETLWNIALSTGNGNPWRWTDILLLNKTKIDYVYFNAEKDFWFVILKAGKRLKVPKEDVKIKPDKSNRRKYAVQLAAYPVWDKDLAYKNTERLVDDGYYAYLYLTPKKIVLNKNSAAQRYYRIRIGFFENRGPALETASEIVRKYRDARYFNDDFFIVKPSPEELGGQLLDYGVQLLNPYAIELFLSEHRDRALKFLKKINLKSHYAYMVKHTVSSAKYSVRIGFFPNQTAAEKFLRRKKVRDSLYFSGQVVHLQNVQESITGQNVNLYFPKDIKK